MVVDVELIQINTTKLRELGMSLSAVPDHARRSTSAARTRRSACPDLEIPQPEQLDADHSRASSTTSSRRNSDAQLLAKPQVRISEGEKAQAPHRRPRADPGDHLQHRAARSGGNIVPITSFQYQDVGIKIDIEPRVHHNKEVTLKLQVEISKIAGYVQGVAAARSSRSSAPARSSRRSGCKDGETNFLAGLIRTDETQSRDGDPRALRHSDHRPAVRQQVDRRISAPTSC